MSDEPENLTLVYLRRIDANVTALRADVSDLKQRVTLLEVQAGQQSSNEQSHYASLMARFDRLEERIERLERHADILPA